MKRPKLVDIWPVRSLGDLIEVHDRFRVPVSASERQKRRGDTPYYGASGVIDTIDGYTHDGRYLLIAEDGENLRSRKTPIAFIAEGRFWANNHIHVLQVLDDRANDTFLCAYIEHSSISGWVTGAAQPKLSQANLIQIPIPLPPLLTQRKIAMVLAAYDELIENNLRRIEILEEMAQTVYREWFVNFRFPGHEDFALVDSPLGLIPDGWEVRGLFDVAEVAFGFAFKSARFSEDMVGEKVVRIRDIPKNRSRTFTDEVAEERYRVSDGDVLIGMDGDFHMCVWSGGPAMLNQRVTRVRPVGAVPELFLFHAMRNPIRHFNSTITGTTVAHLGKRHLETIQLVLPGDEVLEVIAGLFQPILQLDLNLRRQNANLRTTRDLLLPRLLSGALEVSELDIDTEWLAS